MQGTLNCPHGQPHHLAPRPTWKTLKGGLTQHRSGSMSIVVMSNHFWRTENWTDSPLLNWTRTRTELKELVLSVLFCFKTGLNCQTKCYDFILNTYDFIFTFYNHTCHECMFIYFYFLPCIMRMLHASNACLSFLMLHITSLLLYQTHAEHALTMCYTHVLLYIYFSQLPCNFS